MYRLISIALCFLLLQFVTLAHSKSVAKRFGNHGNWIISSGHNNGAKVANICSLYTKRHGFYISYTGHRGWSLSFKLSKSHTILLNQVPTKIVVDGKYLGTLIADVDVKTQFFVIDIGLNTKVLNPIFRGKRHIVFNIGKYAYKIPIRGIGRAYKITLDCWRNRMASVPYKPAVAKSQKNTDLNRLISSEIMGKLFTAGMGYSDAKVERIEGSYNANITLEKSSQPKVIGYVGFKEFANGKYVPSKVSQLIDKIIVRDSRSCNKLAIDKRLPYYITKTVEVHEKISFCSAGSSKVIKEHIWFLQSEKYLLQIMFAPEKDHVEEHYRAALKNIAEYIEKDFR